MVSHTGPTRPFMLINQVVMAFIRRKQIQNKIFHWNFSFSKSKYIINIETQNLPFHLFVKFKNIKRCSLSENSRLYASLFKSSHNFLIEIELKFKILVNKIFIYKKINIHI